MKKVIIAAALILAAAVSQAAAVGWTCLGGTNYKEGSYSFFVIGKNGVTGTDQIKTIVAAGGLSAADSYAYFKGGAVTSAGALSRPNTTTPAVDIAYSGSGTDNYTAFIVVQDKDGKNASFTSTSSITMVDDSTSKTFGFANQATNFSNNSFTVNTPEPTSGVLLLLGMAGLALKRKRA